MKNLNRYILYFHLIFLKCQNYLIIYVHHHKKIQRKIYKTNKIYCFSKLWKLSFLQIKNYKISFLGMKSHPSGK